MESQWLRLKEGMMQRAIKTVGTRKEKSHKKPWVTEGMVEKMREKRWWKGIATEEGKRMYRKLNNKLRRETDKAKEEWFKNRCSEIEELEKRGQLDFMYHKDEALALSAKTWKKKQMVAILIENGDLLTEPETKKHRWKAYIERLYNAQNKPVNLELEDGSRVDGDALVPELITSEIQEAMRRLGRKKAEGCDGISAKFLHALLGEPLNQFIKLCKKIYEKGVWPSVFKRSVLVPLEKKRNATRCEDFRTISLISHAAKVVLRIIKRSLETKAEEFLENDQFKFRKERGTREAIGVMRCLVERRIEFNKDLYVLCRL